MIGKLLAENWLRKSRRTYAQSAICGHGDIDRMPTTNELALLEFYLQDLENGEGHLDNKRGMQFTPFEMERFIDRGYISPGYIFPTNYQPNPYQRSLFRWKRYPQKAQSLKLYDLNT